MEIVYYSDIYWDLFVALLVIIIIAHIKPLKDKGLGVTVFSVPLGLAFPW